MRDDLLAAINRDQLAKRAEEVRGFSIERVHTYDRVKKQRAEARAKLLDEATRRAIIDLPHISACALFQYRGKWIPLLLPGMVLERYRDLAERFPAG